MVGCAPLPEGAPEKTPESEGYCLAMYPESSPNTNGISFLTVIKQKSLISLIDSLVHILPKECTVKYNPRLEVILKELKSQFSTC